LIKQELRLEEYSRLVDIRGTKIETLERQLRNIAAGKYTSIENTESLDNTDQVELLPGENLLTISIGGCKFSQDGIQNLLVTGLVDLEFDKWKTFVVIDFYDFATQVTPLGIGRNPTYNHDMKYVITVDDFFFHYLERTSVSFGLYYSNGLQFVQIGFGVAKFVDIVGSKFKTSSYVIDVLGLDMKPLGKLEYQISLQVSMPLAVKAYHERATALNLLTNSQPENIKVPEKSPVNNLNIKIHDFQFNNAPGTISDLLPYGIIHLDPIWREIQVPPVLFGSGNFRFDYSLPLQIDQELDRYLRTTKITVSFADDAKDWLYGSLKIDLSPLAVNQAISGTFNVMDTKNIKCGQVVVEFSWDKFYHSERPNFVSLIDDESVKQEMIISPSNPYITDLNNSTVTVALPISETVVIPALNTPDLSHDAVITKNSEESILVSNLSLNSEALELPIESNFAKLKGKSFSITIASVQILNEDPQVAALLKATKQIFIAYEFLDFDHSELETPSLVIPDSGLLDVSFVKCKFHLRSIYIRIIVSRREVSTIREAAWQLYCF
jgi:hypothetical protein